MKYCKSMINPKGGSPLRGNKRSSLVSAAGVLLLAAHCSPAQRRRFAFLYAHAPANQRAHSRKQKHVQKVKNYSVFNSKMDKETLRRGVGFTKQQAPIGSFSCYMLRRIPLKTTFNHLN